MQHGDPAGAGAHEVHVVLDHDHRVLARSDSRSSSAVCSGLGVGHAGDRLVDQQQLRLLHQQHADLEPLLLAVATARRPAGSRCAVERDGAEHLVDPVALLAG